MSEQNSSSFNLTLNHSTWYELQELKEEIEREYLNLYKNKTRARTGEGIRTKRSLIQDNLRQFESIISTYETTVSDREWNKLTDLLEIVRNQVRKSLIILEQTRLIPNKVRTNSLNSCVYSEVVIPSNFFDREEPILSSTLIERQEQNPEQPAETSNNTTSFREQIREIRRDFLEDSFDLGKILNKSLPKMAFSQITALQCIPSFDGNSEELDPFLLQVDMFYEQLKTPAVAQGGDPVAPTQAEQIPLLNVVYVKLKGKALHKLEYFKSPTWAEVKAKLEEEFKLEKDGNSLTKGVETLLQKPNETFDEYKERGMELYLWVEDEGPFAVNLLRKHFLGGLRNRGLAQAGKSQRDKTFPELVKWLKKECEDGDEIKDINARAESYHDKNQAKSANTVHKPQNNFKNIPPSGNFRNLNFSNQNANFNRSFQNQRTPYGQNNFNRNTQWGNSNPGNNFQPGNHYGGNNYNPSRQRGNSYGGNNFNNQSNRSQQSSQRAIGYRDPREGPSGQSNNQSRNLQSTPQNQMVPYNQRKN